MSGGSAAEQSGAGIRAGKIAGGSKTPAEGGAVRNWGEKEKKKGKEKTRDELTMEGPLELGAIAKLREEMYALGATLGYKILPDEVCCQLLAWVYMYGDLGEAAVFDDHLRVDVLEAQKRVNMFGAEELNVELVEKMKGYIKELLGEYTEKTFGANHFYEYPRPDWLVELEKRYGFYLQAAEYRKRKEG
jgi:hypothetical protein